MLTADREAEKKARTIEGFRNALELMTLEDAIKANERVHTLIMSTLADPELNYSKMTAFAIVLRDLIGRPGDDAA